MNINWQPTVNRLKEFWKKYGRNKYLLIIIAAGCLLMLLSSGNETPKAESTENIEIPTFSLSKQEERFSRVLSKVSGAGKVSVVLTVSSSVEQERAWDREQSEQRGEEGGSESESSVTAVKVQTGSGEQSAVTVKYIYPEYQGALVISQGAGSATVRLALTQAIAALTGLETDKITVLKMED